MQPLQEEEIWRGPDEYKNENDQGTSEGIPGTGRIFAVADIRGVQLVARAPNRLVYTEADLRIK